MEVHRHSHSGHDNKKWTHYLWEFFMLFLAVMAGFLVENWREHYIEHKRAKVLAASIYSDIKKDTAALADIIAFSNDKFVNIERLQQELRKYGTPVCANSHAYADLPCTLRHGHQHDIHDANAPNQQ